MRERERGMEKPTQSETERERERERGVIERAAASLSVEVRELSLGTSAEVERLGGAPSPLLFLREYVAPSRPCIIQGAISHWPALRLWSNAYLRSRLHDSLVSLHFTPDGRADALAHEEDLGLGSGLGCPDREKEGLGSGLELANGKKEGLDQKREVQEIPGQEKEDTDEPWFVTAYTEKMAFPQALELITASPSDSLLVAYAQEQNGCFLSEYGELRGDAEDHIPWATEALGCMPEAVNLWIGNERAHTSFHKDHYENLYVVVAGEKHFTLLPPTDLHRLYVKNYKAAHYTRTKSGRLRMEPDVPAREVPWVSVDPYPPPPFVSESRQRFSRYFDGPEPFTCTVKAGEILYLPSMWFHHVRQTPDREGRTIAINYWYDMQFDVKFAYFNFLQSLVSNA